MVPVERANFPDCIITHPPLETLRFGALGLGAPLPGMAVGLAADFSLDRFLDAERFQRLVLVLLIGLGATLLLG